MAAINVVEAGILWSGARDTVIAGATITQGMPLYLDLTTGRYKPTDCDAAASSVFAGWSLGAASEGQPVELGYGDGELNCGGTVLTVGLTYYAGPGAGEIEVRATVTTGMFVCPLGVARTTSILRSGSLAYMSAGAIVSA